MHGEELGCSLSGDVGVGLEDIPAGDYVAGGELLTPGTGCTSKC
jgi:hypothetical protein